MKNQTSSIFLMLCALAVFGQGIQPAWSIDYPDYADIETAQASFDWSEVDTTLAYRRPIRESEAVYYWQGKWWNTESLMEGKTDFKFRCSLKFERKGLFATKCFFENVTLSNTRVMRIRQLMRLDGYAMGWDGYICEAVPFIDDCYEETDAKRLRDSMLRALLKSQHIK